MKKIISLFFLLLLSNLSFAQDVTEPPAQQTTEDDYYRTQLVMTNTMHQFVYAFFGKDILLNYLVDKDDVRVIRESRNSDLQHFAKPFNTLMSKFVLAGVVGIYWVTVGYFLLRLLAFSGEYGWLLQRKGTTPMDKETFKGFSIRLFLLAGMAVAPMSISLEGNKHYIAVYNLFLFDLIGKAHQMGDDALTDMISKQRPSLITTRIPHADSRWSSGLALNDYMTCMRLNANRENIAQFTQNVSFFHVNGGVAEGIINSGRCNIRFRFGYDTATQNILNELKSLNPSMPIDATIFADAQKDVFKTIIEQSTVLSTNFSRTLALPIYQNSLVAFANEDRTFATSEWTSKFLSNYELERWEGQCSNVHNWQFPHESISNRDREVYHLVSGRCISRFITESLLYPAVFGNTAAFFEDQHLRNRHLPLCIDEMEFNKSLAGSRYVPRYQLNNSTDATSDEQNRLIENLPLDACLSQFCSQSSLSQGGLYSCVNAIDTYRQRQKDQAMQERGVLMLGFYMFNLYTNQTPTDRAKHIYQSTRFEFSTSEFTALEKTEDTPLFTSQITIPALTNSHGNRLGDVENIMMSPFQKESFSLIEPFDNKALSSTALNALQLSRLLTCAKNPLQITEGYVCGNLPQEFSAFGMNVLRFAVAAKSLIVLGDALGNMRNSAPEVGTLGKQNVMNGVGPLLAVIGVGALGNSIVDGVMDSGFAATDDFGYLDQKTVRQFLFMNSEQITILSLAILSVNEVGGTLYRALDKALLLLLIVGILFALVIPLMPMLLVMYALVKFMYLLCLTIIMTGINLINAAFEEEPGFLTENVDKIWSDWLALILKLPLLFIGIILAWLMSNVIIAHALQRMEITFVTNDGSMGPIDTLVMLVVTFGIVFVVYNMVMTVIESFYDFTVEWILGQMSNSPFSDRRAIGWKDSKDILALMGR